MKNTVQRYRLFVYLQGKRKKKGVEKTPFMFFLHFFVWLDQKLQTTVAKRGYST